MEDFPRVPSHEAPDDDQDKKKKRKKSASSIPLVSVEHSSEQQEPPKKEASALDKALANLAVKKREQAETERAVEKAEATRGEVPSESITAEANDKPAEEAMPDAEKPEEPEAVDDKKDRYERLPEYEPAPTEFSGGEVIIHLQGDEPLAERVVTLQPEAEESPTSEPFETPVPAAQQEQHRAHEEAQSPSSEQAEPTSATSGGEVPPTVPPEKPVPSSEQPPEPERVPMPVSSESIRPEPAQVYREYMQREAATRQAVSSEHVATKQDMEDALYYATKTGQNRGVVTGLLVGGAYEHFKHKRREKRANKRFQTQGKQLEAARQSYNFGLQEHARQQAETTARFNVAERRFESAEQRFQNQNRSAAERQPVRTPERVVSPANPEQLIIPPEHRLETSAWHSIEVDAKTGKPVEMPAFQYGQEYYRERAQEATPTQQRNAAAGEVALVAAAGGVQSGSSAQDDGRSQPPVQIPSATRQGPPSSSPQASRQSSSNATPPVSPPAPLWPWLLALAVVVISLLFVAA